MTRNNETRKAKRKERERSERRAGRDLDRLTDDALAIALELVSEVAVATASELRDRAIDVEFSSIDAARFAQKRINEALGVREWSDEVRAWVWVAGERRGGPARSDHGRQVGFELRLERLR